MRNNVKYFDYPAQFLQYKASYMKIIDKVLSRGAYILGEDLRGFEIDLARFCGSKYAVGVGNCTDALLLSLMAAGIGPGDEVITSSHTFVATVEVIRMVGAKPVFVDIAHDHNMDAGLIEKLVTRNTKAIMPVHLNGHICSAMDRIMRVAEKHGLMVIEDAAQALGAAYKGKQAGTFGIAGCFSFYPAKLLGAFGDAGAVVTDDKEFAHKLTMLRNHGRGDGVEVRYWGLNCRMDNLHAALLARKLKNVKRWIERRRHMARIYDRMLSRVPELRLPLPPARDNSHFDVFQNYEIEAQRRDELVAYLKDNSIGVLLPWGGKPVHQFKALGLPARGLVKTDELFKKVLMLPMYIGLTDAQVRYVAGKIKEFYTR